MSNETTYLGTKLAPDDYREFSIRAAQRGISRSALLAELARNLIATSTPAGPKRALRGKASRKSKEVAA